MELVATGEKGQWVFLFQPEFDVPPTVTCDIITWRKDVAKWQSAYLAFGMLQV